MDLYPRSRALNHDNLSLLPFNCACYEPGLGNHQRRERKIPGIRCIYCSCLRARHNIDHPNDRWDPNIVYLMINGQRVRRSMRRNTEQELVCRCLTCLFPLCYYHHDPFHDIDNEEANLPGPRREYVNNEE